MDKKKSTTPISFYLFVRWTKCWGNLIQWHGLQWIYANGIFSQWVVIQSRKKSKKVKYRVELTL